MLCDLGWRSYFRKGIPLVDWDSEFLPELKILKPTSNSKLQIPNLSRGKIFFFLFGLLRVGSGVDVSDVELSGVEFALMCVCVVWLDWLSP